MHETLRMIMARVIAGFDMKLRKHNNLNEGQWVEYNPALMSIPTPDFVTSRGSSMLIHQLNKYQGHRVVQSVGRGMITIGDGQTESNYDVDFNGVSIYDHDEGYMTERVWALHGNATASSYLAEGKAARPYWHAGRVVMLDPDEKPNVGRSVPVAAPGQPPWEGEEAWWVLEDD